jgi:hypothetical protein
MYLGSFFGGESDGDFGDLGGDLGECNGDFGECEGDFGEKIAKEFGK